MDPDHLEKLRIRSEAKQRPRWTVRVIVLLVLAGVGGALYLAWPRVQDRYRVLQGGTNSPPPATTNTAAAPPPSASAASTNGEVLLTVSGYIINRERIEISPRFLGQVKWIGVKKGDAVTNGQVVVVLDDSEHKARLAEAEARIANARASVDKAQLDHGRVLQLIREKIETRQNEDDARIRLEAARAALQEAEAQAEVARTYLSWTVIRSPVDGVVLEKLADVGELVTPQSFGGVRGPSTALLAVANPNDLQVEIDLNETDLSKVFLGQRCRVSPEAYPERSYEGWVAERSPEANRQKGTLQIKVQIRAPDRFLTPELSAKVDFLADPARPAGR